MVTVALDAVDHLPVAVESTKASRGPAPSVVTTVQGLRVSIVFPKTIECRESISWGTKKSRLPPRTPRAAGVGREIVWEYELW